MDAVLEQLRHVATDDAWVLVIAAASTVATVPLTAWIVVRLPEDYFVNDAEPALLAGYPGWLRVLASILKGLVATVLVAAGLVMAVPGVPGQGLLTMLAGLLLLDFPGKRALERRLFRLHAIHVVANAIRGRFGRPPLVGLDGR